MGEGHAAVINLMLTGVPGIGKTTVIEAVADLLKDRAGGMVTKEIREAGRRTGFSVESLDGRRRTLASRHVKGGPKVGPYTVMVENLDEVGVRAIELALQSKDIVIVDEIGKMELISAPFRDIIIRALDSSVDLVATLGVARNPFLDGIRRRQDIELLEVTMANREHLAREIVKRIASAR